MDEASGHSQEVDEGARKQDRPKEEVKEEIVKLGPNLIGTEHYFVMERSGDGHLVAQCTKCPHGYHLSAGETVKDGHIYGGGDLII